MAHFYLREIANPNVVVSFGHTLPGHYNFDPAFYEEIEGDLPADAVQGKQKSLADRLNDVYNAMDVAKRVQYGELKAAVKAFLEQPEPDVAATLALIQMASIPEEDEAIRANMLACFSEAGSS